MNVPEKFVDLLTLLFSLKLVFCVVSEFVANTVPRISATECG